MNTNDNLGFVIVKFLFIVMIQEFNSMQRFLEAGVEGLWIHVLRFFLATAHVMEETVAVGNGVSSRSYIIQETVANFVERVFLVHSIGIF